MLPIDIHAIPVQIQLHNWLSVIFHFCQVDRHIFAAIVVGFLRNGRLIEWRIR